MFSLVFSHLGYLCRNRAVESKLLKIDGWLAVKYVNGNTHFLSECAYKQVLCFVIIIAKLSNTYFLCLKKVNVPINTSFHDLQIL